MFTTEEVVEIFARYERTFKVVVPRPRGLHEITIARICAEALAMGEPIADAYDWFSHIDR